jgi:hypothetical protein
MKRLLMLAMLALSILSVAHTSNIESPYPECDPCPIAR